MTEQKCTKWNIVKKQMVNEPIWHSVGPIQATGDVPYISSVALAL